jgi:large subunit ribosomal protein L21
MKYAIVQLSGKQFLIKVNQWYDIDFISKKFFGEYLFLQKILLFRKKNQIQLGQPFLEKSKIIVKIFQNIKGEKITIVKTKPKKKLYSYERSPTKLYTY